MCLLYVYVIRQCSINTPFVHSRILVHVLVQCTPRASNRVCIVVYDNNITIVLIVISLFNIYYMYLTPKINIRFASSYFNSTTLWLSLRIHISPIKFRCIRNVLVDPPIEVKQPKSPDFEMLSIFTKYNLHGENKEMSVCTSTWFKY